jgi:hypothetical protein
MRLLLLLASLELAGHADSEEADLSGGPATAGAVPADPTLPASLTDEGNLPVELASLAHSLRDRPLDQRISALSKALLGVPWLNNPAGEGRSPDLDPPARYDAFDCLTYVEEVLALAFSPDPRGIPTVRRALRYGAEVPPNYEDRLHFMELQWVPAAVKAGFLQDITHEIGETRRVRKQVGPNTWRAWSKRKLFNLPDHKLPTGEIDIQLLPLSEALAHRARIPNGSILLLVRQDRPQIPILVSHLGFVLQENQETWFRHSTKMGKKPRSRTDRLSWYLEHNRQTPWWPVEGVAIFAPLEQGPRRTRLPP